MRKLYVLFPSIESWSKQKDHIQHAGLYLPTPIDSPNLQEEISLCINTPNGNLDVEVKVIHIIESSGMAVSFLNPDQDIEKLMNLITKPAAPLSEKPEIQPPKVQWTAFKTASNKCLTEPSGTLYDQIRAMSLQQRMQLARHGSKAERQILLKDLNKNVHVFLVQNPHLRIDEARTLAMGRQTNPEALKLISKNREWMQNSGIVMALIRNPKTSSAIATRLLDRVGKEELRQLAKSNNIPKVVSLAARRKITS